MNHDNTPQKISISVVIPLYNEALRIKQCFAETLSYFQNFSASFSGFEIIFVSEPSNDGTNEILRKLVDLHPRTRIKLLINNKREGKGFSFRRGFLSARNEWVLFYDADLSVPLQEFSKFLPYTREYDMVVASRILPGASVVRAPMRRFLSRGLHILRKILFHSRVKDSQCGFKLFRRIRCKMIVEKLQSRNFFFDVELLVLSERAGLRIKEVPVSWTDGEGSSYSVPKTIFNFLMELVRLRLRL